MVVSSWPARRARRSSGLLRPSKEQRQAGRIRLRLAKISAAPPGSFRSLRLHFTEAYPDCGTCIGSTRKSAGREKRRTLGCFPAWLFPGEANRTTRDLKLIFERLNGRVLTLGIGPADLFLVDRHRSVWRGVAPADRVAIQARGSKTTGAAQ